MPTNITTERISDLEVTCRAFPCPRRRAVTACTTSDQLTRVMAEDLTYSARARRPMNWLKLLIWPMFWIGLVIFPSALLMSTGILILLAIYHWGPR